jgi:hypothetical protein
MALGISIKCHYVECHFAEDYVLFIVVMSVIMLNVSMLSVTLVNVVMLNVDMLSVLAPFYAMFESINVFLAKRLWAQCCSTNFMKTYAWIKKF